MVGHAAEQKMRDSHPLVDSEFAGETISGSLAVAGWAPNPRTVDHMPDS
jgi:hypothetical protein